ncbi:peptidase M16 family protein [Pedobacter africanus]|uniref:Peptidase M16 inactive domain-containing protein n=1 Tax=Pedobacter africanus TaxID=151894 RepID=A0A1W2A319_9SPHI|nr:insulinase family protein [Pedobacter africanus]SMC55139.1 Peptidase M16 inactive domain-containing protein [Pedobacter africanus]
MKNPVSYTLKNGTTIIVAHNEATPKVFANLSFEAANVYTPAKATVQEVFNTLLNQQLTALDAGLSYSHKGINLATYSDDFETALQSMYACINAPAFDQEDLAKAKASVMEHLKAQDKYFPEAVNENSIAKLTLADVNAYYAEINNPAQIVLTIAGNVTPAVAKNFAKKAIEQQKPMADISKNYLVSNN